MYNGFLLNPRSDSVTSARLKRFFYFFIHGDFPFQQVIHMAASYCHSWRYILSLQAGVLGGSGDEVDNLPWENGHCCCRTVDFLRASSSARLVGTEYELPSGPPAALTELTGGGRQKHSSCSRRLVSGMSWATAKPNRYSRYWAVSGFVLISQRRRCRRSTRKSLISGWMTLQPLYGLFRKSAPDHYKRRPIAPTY